VIAAGVLENPQGLYDLKTFTFNQGAAMDLINRWRNSKHYSEIFRSIVSNLVQLNPENRLSSEELWKWIVKYEASIKSKEKFLITSVPAQIEKEVSELRKVTKSTVTTNQHQTYEHPKEVHA
jgi:serine/threonine protein kinase